MTMVETIDGGCGTGTKTAPSENRSIAVPALATRKPIEMERLWEQVGSEGESTLRPR